MSTWRPLEVGILSSARTKRAVLAEIEGALEGYQFADPGLDWLYSAMTEAWKIGEAIQLPTLQAKVRLEPLESQEVLLRTVIEVWRAPPSGSIQTDLKVLLDHRQGDQLVRGIDRAVKHLEAGENAEASVALAAASAQKPDGIQAKSLIDWSRWEPVHERGVLTGIRLLDEAMGGIRGGELGIIFGSTGMGKSILAINFSVTAITYNKKVLYVDTENGEDLVRWRHVSRFLNLPTKALSSGMLLPSDKARLDGWARRQKARIDERLKILSIGVDITSLAELQSAVSRLKRQGFDPDMVMFDSPDHVMPDGRQSDNYALTMKEVYGRLKGWSQQEDFGLWAVTQAKAEAQGRVATAKNIAWGYDKARMADAVVSINAGRDPDTGRLIAEENLDGQRELFVAKARDARARFSIPLDTRLGHAWIKASGMS